MADTHVHHRAKFVWTWIVLGIVVVVALIWWIGDTNTAPTQAATGAGTADTVQTYDKAGASPAADQTANPGAAAANSPAASAPAASGDTTSPAA